MAVPPCLAPRIATRPVCAWLRLLLGWPGDAHLEQAIPHRGLDLVGLDREWQRQPAVERAKAALHAVVILLLDLALGCARASDDQAAIVQLNLHVFVLEPRQVGLDDQRIVLLVDIHPRRPRHALAGGTSEERNAPAQNGLGRRQRRSISSWSVSNISNGSQRRGAGAVSSRLIGIVVCSGMQTSSAHLATGLTTALLGSPGCRCDHLLSGT